MVLASGNRPVYHDDQKILMWSHRLNKTPPNIYYKRKDKGGVNFQTTCSQSELDADLVQQVLHEYKIHNADVTLREDATVDQLIDVIEGNRVTDVFVRLDDESRNSLAAIQKTLIKI